MNLAKRLGIIYLKGIDALIRFIGSYIIMCLFVLIIYGLSLCISFLPFMSVAPQDLTWILSLLLLPFIVRFGVLAGGLSIPPIFGKKNQTDSIPNKLVGG